MCAGWLVMTRASKKAAMFQNVQQFDEVMKEEELNSDR